MLGCRLSKGKQLADAQDGIVAGAYGGDRHGSRWHRGGGIENDKACNNVPCYGTAQNVLLVEQDGSVKGGSVKDRIFCADLEDHIDANDFRDDSDAAYRGNKRGVLLLTDSHGADRTRDGCSAEACHDDAGETSRSCQRRRDLEPAAGSTAEQVAAVAARRSRRPTSWQPSEGAGRGSL